VIKAAIRPGDLEAAKFRLGSVVDAVNTRIGEVIVREATNLVAYVVRNKLNGQVLGTPTGRLRRSITYRIDRNGDSFSAVVGTIVKYARPLEYGFTGTVGVRGHTRTIHKAFGRAIAEKTINVRPHEMRMNLKPHPFMRPSLEENRARIIKNIALAVKQGNAK
jgi:hypothetical protein